MAEFPTPLKPVPTSEWERMMDEAADAFKAGHVSRGLVNLAHASYVAKTRPEPLEEHLVLAKVRKVIGFSYTPEDPGGAA